MKLPAAILLSLALVGPTFAAAPPPAPPAADPEADLPPTAAPKDPPPLPRDLPAPPAQVRPVAPPALPSQGQWVYTRQYGWVWMPYGDPFVALDGPSPFQFFFTVELGWGWRHAPWIWGWGPTPWFGPLGPWHYGWWGVGHGPRHVFPAPPRLHRHDRGHFSFPGRGHHR